MFNLYSTLNKRNAGDDKDQPKELETTGHDRFYQRPSRSAYRKKHKRPVRRAQSAAEFKPEDVSVAQKRNLFKGRSASTEHYDGEQTEKSPLVSAKLETFARILFNRSFSSQESSSGSTSNGRPSSSPTRHSLKFQYSALDSGNGSFERSPRERANRDRSLTACQEWIKNTQGRYEIIAHLDNIGCRNNKNWFLLNDTTVRTDRLMTLLPIPADCVALDGTSHTAECPKGILMELLASLQHPYIYPVLDLGFLYTNQQHYACLVMPFNSRGSLKDLIYKSQWNEAWNRKYTRKSTCLPLSQVQRLGRQILEALLFLRERGFPSHGHLHSGNVILQNGVARLSGLENGLLGLNSRVNAVVWSRNVTDLEYMDIVCFGHLLFEMCTGYELNVPHPSPGHFQLDLERYPQVVDVLQLIFDPQDNRLPTLEDLVLCDLFRNIDLRELRGPSVSSFKHGLSTSTLNLLNAVRRRQGASLNGSYSEGSSPCTPPSTPRDRRMGSHEIDSFDISSDSEGILDEIVITTSNLDLSNYGLLTAGLSSPIHFCDNSMQSDDGSSTKLAHHSSSRSISGEDSDMIASIQIYSNQLTTDSCTSKNSKSRRMEYSMRGMKLCSSSNPSQDSAFGSMTDGELSIASSSIRMSSFQSISSPIDEGVEDSVTGMPGPMVSRSTSPNKEMYQQQMMECKIAQSASETSLAKKRSPRNSAGASAVSTSSTALSGVMTLDPPKILVNDKNSFYTTSPSRAFGTIEVFSQKYRVCSFEDMSSRKTHLKSMNRQAFRSLEEERRIDSAFTPVDKHHAAIQQQRSFDASQVMVNNPEKFKKLTHTAFTRKTSTTKERHSMWKNSILVRKNNLIKSNESLHDQSASSSMGQLKRGVRHFREPITSSLAFASSSSANGIHERVNSTNELHSAHSADVDRTFSLVDDEFRTNPRKSSSERYLLSLTKFKQTAINDYEECDEDDANAIDRSEIKSFIDDSSSSSSSNGTNTPSSSTSSPSHREICQFIGGVEPPDARATEDKVPLLDGMEMSPISPVDADAML